MPTVAGILSVIDLRGGLASTGELRQFGIDREFVRMAAAYGRVLRVRKGWWSRRELPRDVLAAHRAGGRLACVSALAFHGVIEPVPGRVHISAPDGVRKWRPGRRRVDAIRHWSRIPVPGDRMAVAPEAAWAQFALCREAHGRDIRLARTG